MAKKTFIKNPDAVIIDKIVVLRKKKVMLDKDLAELYGVTTKRLNEQVKRNMKRFPADFMFQMTKDEKEEVVANCDHLQNLRFSAHLPYVFTEHGAVMLASVLNSDIAIAANIRIVKVFTQIRQIVTDASELRLEIEKIKKKLDQHGQDFELIFKCLNALTEKAEKPRKKIGYKISKD